STAYWDRPDLGIGTDDVHIANSQIEVTVHSLGSVDAPAARLVLRDRDGQTLASAATPALKAPVDLIPKTAVVKIALPAGAVLQGGSITIETAVPEITLLNNRVKL